MSDQLESGADGADGASDTDLVLRSRSGDTDAFGELWNRHYRSGIVAARGISPTLDPDDVVQEAYTKIFQTVKRGGGPTGSFRAYLFTAIRNTAASWGRDDRDTTIEAAEHLEDPETSEEATEAALDRGITHQAFRSLPTRWQEVLWYTEIEQMKPREVAPLLGIKPVAVSQLASRAREGLREAWIQAHLSNVEDGSEHQWAIEHLGAHTRGNLARRDRERLADHLAECARCTIVAEEAHNVGSRLAMVLLPLAIGIPAAGAYLSAQQRDELGVVALMAMPAEVIEGGIAAGGAVIAGGAALVSGGAGSGGTAAGSAGPVATLTLGSLVTAGLATAAIAIAVATGIPAHDGGGSEASAGSFSSGAPGAASITASDDLTEAADETAQPVLRQSPSPIPAPSPSQTPTPAPSPSPGAEAADLGIEGAHVVNAARGSVSLDIVGTPGALASVHAPGATELVSIGGSADKPALAAIGAVDGARLDQTTIGAGGSATLTFALSPAQVRADVTLTVLYVDSAEVPARATLSALGIRDELLAALESDETPSPVPSPEEPELPEPSPWEPSTPPVPTPEPKPAEPEPTEPEPTVPAEPTPEPTPTPTPAPEEPEVTPEPRPTPSEEPSQPPHPQSTPEPKPTKPARPVPTSEPTPEPTPTPPPEPKPTPTPTPEPEPKPTPTPEPKPTPTPTPTPEPTLPAEPTDPPLGGGSPEGPHDALDAPEITSITVQDGDLTIDWEDVDDAEEYRVFISHTPAFVQSTEINGSPVSESTLTTAAPLTLGTYYFFVEASAEGFESTRSSAEPHEIVLAAPANVTATVDGPEVTVSWESVHGATGYEISYSPTVDGTVIGPFTAGASATEYGPITPASGTYYFSVTAMNGNAPGESTVTDAVTIALLPPTDVEVSSDGIVTWTASETTSDDFEYKVYRQRIEGGAREHIGTTSASENSFTDEDIGLEVGTCRYWVVATDGDSEAFSTPAYLG